MKNNDTIEKTLKDILISAALSETEARAFTFLVTHEDSFRASEIAKRTKLNRTTLYSALNTLSEKGLVSHSDENGILRFRSIEPHLLLNYLKKNKEKITHDIAKTEALLPALERARGTGERYRPNMQFFDGVDGIKQVYEDLIANNKEKKVYGFTGIHAVYKLMGEEWINHILRYRPAMGVKWFAIAIDSPESRNLYANDEKHLRETKFLPAEYNFEVELAAYDDKVAAISFAEDYPWAMIINDKKIADTIKAVFRYVNETLPSPKSTDGETGTNTV
ncbi:helix-turn-helix domain-containing protein [Patescibacteria group bacterium]|nr:helix-turn-helix domain-containing protein [Patescibacteria group bacterium]